MARKFDIMQNPYFQQFQATSTGMQAGSQFGPTGAAVGAVVGGIGGIAADYMGQRNQINQLNPQLPSEQVDAFGRPQYNLGMAVSSFNGKNNYGKDLWKKGAILGGGGALVGGLLGRNLKNKAQEQINKAQTNIQAAQSRYNQQALDYNQNYLARQQYEDQFS